MKRAAICLSGHMRRFENSRPQLDYLLNSFKDYQVDIFLATWTEIDTDDGPKGVEGRGRNRGEIHKDEVIIFYRLVDLWLSNYNALRWEFKWDNFCNTKPQGFPAHYYIVNDVLICAPQFYNIWRANELKKDYEKHKCFVYDTVIRARPDFLPAKPFQPIESKGIVFPIQYTEGGRIHALDDRFCYGNSAAMDVFAGIWSNLKHLTWNYDAAKFPYQANEAQCQHLSSERIIHRHLVENNVLFEQDNRIELARV